MKSAKSVFFSLLIGAVLQAQEKPTEMAAPPAAALTPEEKAEIARDERKYKEKWEMEDLAAVEKHIRLRTLLGSPDWLIFGLNHRLRYEYLGNQFRPGAGGDDQVLALRTLFNAEIRPGKLRLGVELADSRAYFMDNNTPVDTTLVNSFEILQGYAGVVLPDLFMDADELRAKAGRMTIDAGSRRLAARNRYRNTFNNFTGIDTEYKNSADDRLRIFATVPVQRLPEGRDDLVANQPFIDKEALQTFFGGAYLESRKRFAPFATELYMLTLQENDAPDFATRDRKLLTPGARIYTNPKPDMLDFEIESAFQTGTSRLTTKATDTRDLDHLAWFVHVSFGYTFKSMLQLRPSLEYDYASGDSDPNDNKSGRFDPLYGARRFMFGPTSIYGAFALSNINSPGVRVEVKPNNNLRAFVFYRALWLAEAKDAWTTTSIQDKTGNSGSFLGQQLEGEISYRLFPGNVTIDCGFAYLWSGSFQQNLGQATANTAYAFAGMTFEL